mmetsp:Transcript_28702/g.37634  ORF Transcript_28702/g.37634 Transcript_28702/m.37634 type:complete len:227 (-) Transcript_28702:366-1046(-)|eukprot:CAMPEP_0117745036 /NCGR_PEP_ID=MMETSP0947-20121206/7119_1 /TAXON_ID=44440 /ORGANISM="Chattonella subsalsa, Strain CCMP2191" /LENGTH=226 /DNA_ID=CAMNT_0005562107 /DNA_START=174 /DNA_END=854 /DNA_ORIENTATION=-
MSNKFESGTITEQYDVMYKIVLVGDPGVGKTNLLSCFTSYRKDAGSNSGTVASFNENRKPTVGVEFATWIVKHPNGDRIKAQIWDTAGQERYHAITKSHYRRAAGAMLVYDVTSRASFENAKNMWLKELRESADSESNLLDCTILVGNKTDLEDKRTVSEAEMSTAAAGLGLALSRCTSAKTGENVDQAFEELIIQVYNCDKAKRGTFKGGVQLKNSPQDRQGACC